MTETYARHGATIDRLHAATARLTNRVSESKAIRVRFTKALDMNRWPKLRPMAQLFTNIQHHAS